MKTLFKNVLILDGKSACAGCVLVDGGVIAYAGPDKSFEADETVDGRGRILMPALYNAHTHAAMTLLRGLGSDLPLQKWLTQAIFPAEEKLTPQIIYDGTMLAAAEMLRFGTAGFADMYYFMDDACRAACDSGMRISASWASSIENQRALYEKWSGKTDLVRIYAGIHAEYTTDAAYIADVVAFARERGLPVHVHVSETASEHEQCIERHGRTPAEYFASLGVFERGGIAAHCVYLSENDQSILRENRVFAVHNPVSNLKLASGVMPMAEFLRGGVPVALGTDGCASNNNLNMFEEIRFAGILHKGVGLDPTLVSPKAVFDAATRQGALACGFENCGVIEPGAKADLILVDTDVPHAVPMADPYAHIVYSAQGSDVSLTMVGGRVLYRDGEYTSLDIAKVIERGAAAARALAL